ncbi:MAG: antibiotic biosynthesis monooxygenase [Clostridia bacterium]|jgi:autoinducer 2-degrading protein|nr:antibiotic biosynthesis monooxygenase [Clostridia bacterium]
MIAKSITLYVKPEHVKEFIEATLENQSHSIKEEGIVCFDFFECKDDATQFLLYEVYKSEDDINAHAKTEHYKKWVTSVEPWFSRPRDRGTYIPVLQAE